ncbi:Crp/Fnr family transcriptional regulator [Lewinella sp. W8]|uniref:Crp/Fnr family transcriptional regulator n=1 Tax=Lewinella sp. W8 TaxID=2528208 RepID=UPI0010682C5D|nr:Crp/Fnr family transcriptional regulator [Lewinella sp. W8]MTB50282.1 helix-turn-helix domain-containing protein [Lewinella sp. W8]
MQDQLTPDQVRQYFPDFSEPELQDAIAEMGKIHRFREGQVIMDYGVYVRMLPLILSGTIKISRQYEDGTELFLYYLTRGDSCTMTFSCCMMDKQSEIRAVAEEDTTILALPQRVLDEWMMKYKSWKNFVLLAYDQRMNELVTTIDQVTFNQLDSRLLDYLTKKASLTDGTTISTTHQQIADDLHVSREAISRLLKTMEKREMIKLGRNRIEIQHLGQTS